MKMMNVLTSSCLVLTLNSCGFKVKLSGDPKIHIDGNVDVNHNIKIDSILDFYRNLCKSKLGPVATIQQLDDCQTDAVDEFWNAVNGATPSTPSTP